MRRPHPWALVQIEWVDYFGREEVLSVGDIGEAFAGAGSALSLVVGRGVDPALSLPGFGLGAQFPL